MTDGIYAKLTNTEYTNNIVDFVKARGKLYKVKITSNVENAMIKMDGVIKDFGMYAENSTIKYEVSAEGYTTKIGSINVEKSDKTENIELEVSNTGRNKATKQNNEENNL